MNPVLKHADCPGFGETLLRDVRFGARLLCRNPGFTCIAVLTLALGIGATSGVFSLVQGVLLTPPPYLRSERIVLISPQRLDGQPYAHGLCAAQWVEWQNEAKTFDAIAGYNWGFDFLILPDHSESVEGLWVTADYFRVTGIKPLLGHEFLKSEAPGSDGRETSIILGYRLWQRLFKGDSKVIGKSVHLSRRPPLTVIGVLPPGVRFLPSARNAAEPNYDVNAEVDFLIQTSPEETPPKLMIWSMVGRLREGMTAKRAQIEMAAIVARQADTDHDFERITAKVQSLATELNLKGRRVLLPLFGAVALVFLIACANVTGLLLARGLERQLEYVVRCAIGARRSQLFRQVLTESMLLAISGGALGMGLAIGLIKFVKFMGVHAIPRLDAVTLGWPVLASGFALAWVATLLAGLGPALNAARRDPANAITGIRGTSMGPTGRRFLGGVVILQIALTFALLVGAGLLIRTVNKLGNIRPGYETQNLLTMNVTMPDQTKFADFHAQALVRISALPGVKKVAFGWGVPLTGNSWMNQVRIEGQSVSDTGTGKDFKNELAIATRSVTPDYFDALGLRLVRGRVFRSTDSWYGPDAATNAPFVAVINETMARKYFAKGNPIGSKLRFSPGIGQSAQIIGVITDARDAWLTEKPEPEVYFSLWQLGPFTKHLVIRTRPNPRSLIGAVQRELRAIDPTVAVEQVKTLEEIRTDSIAPQTFAMRLLVGFSLAGSVLALVGIYGVLSLSVGSRTRELAIRMAIGAQRDDLLGLVLREGLRLVGVGLVLGFGVAIAMTQVLRGLLFGVGPTDPVTFVAVAILFTAVALLACLVPAVRAMRVNPMEALRHE
jgi:putative ABC transport system permease protein